MPHSPPRGCSRTSRRAPACGAVASRAVLVGSRSECWRESDRDVCDGLLEPLRAGVNGINDVTFRAGEPIDDGRDGA